MVKGAPAASFKFNTFQEIKSHSSILYNERMAILFYLLDMKSISMNVSYGITEVLEVRAIIKQIYKNIRMLIRINHTMRSTLNLDTKDSGIYTTDIAMGMIDRMIDYCEGTEYTTRRLYIIVYELNSIETLIKDVLQYFHYFIRPDFKQKPDIEIATERYKEIADTRTIEELQEIVGKRHKIDFEALGTERVDLLDKEEDEIDEEEHEMNEDEMNKKGDEMIGT